MCEIYFMHLRFSFVPTRGSGVLVLVPRIPISVCVCVCVPYTRIVNCHLPAAERAKTHVDYEKMLPARSLVDNTVGEFYPASSTKTLYACGLLLLLLLYTAHTSIVHARSLEKRKHISDD